MADKDLVSQQEARDAVESAYLAFREIAKFNQAKIDRICEVMAQAALSESMRLGQMANKETGFGVANDKYEKNRFAAEDVWNYFRDLKTVGVIADKENVVEIASPRGVVAAIIPSTNPTSTAIFKIIISIKSRNSVVLSPHPSAARSIAESAKVMKDAGIKEGLPPNAVQCLSNSTIEGTETLMKHKRTAVILATGGIGLVRAAYSSGKPAFGVGPGNVPVFIEKTADLQKAAADILTSTCFDNGTICASEQSVVVDSSISAKVRNEFQAQGGYFLNSNDAEKVGKVLLTSQRTLNPKIVGKSAQHIANLAGVSIPSETRCLIADCGGVGRDYPWSIEKLSPTLAFFEVDEIEQGANLCEEILRFGGMGHTAGMHTNDRNAAVRFGQQMPASRIIINSPTTHGAIGFSTDLVPSMTLGCGSWGGNVTSDNVSPHNLMDIKRVAFETKPLNSAGKITSNQAELKSNITTANNIPKREEIAAIVDSFLSKKLSNPQTTTNISKPSVIEKPPTVIHHVSGNDSVNKSPVVFVNEDDVRNALEKKKKIYINKKTIITPAAKDLGKEREVFIQV